MFVDRVKIRVRAGNGGRGCISFRREKFVPRGGPDGGDGGDGGDVVFRAAAGEQSLVALYYLPHYEAGNGQPGRGKKQHGARGASRIVTVPVGTIVRDAETGEMLADLCADGMEAVVARGGRGGRGNTHFVTSTRRAPRIADPGTPGEERELIVELKTLADIGLVGYPNAGKSSLVAAVSQARPKTAPYPFTTRRPVVGVVAFPDFFRFTLADIPGLIDGAHRNVGLGHDFLRHIERAPILAYVLDAAGVDGRTPWDDFRALRRELRLYRPDLVERPALIVANKIDLPEAAEHIERLKRETDLPIFPTSVLEGAGLPELVAEFRRRVEEERRKAEALREEG